MQRFLALVLCSALMFLAVTPSAFAQEDTESRYVLPNPDRSGNFPNALAFDTQTRTYLVWSRWQVQGAWEAQGQSLPCFNAVSGLPVFRFVGGAFVRVLQGAVRFFGGRPFLTAANPRSGECLVEANRRFLRPVQ